MPVVTRSMKSSPTLARSMKSSPTLAISFDDELKRNFVADMRRLLACCDNAQGKENKIRVCAEIYETINKVLPKLIEKYKYFESWYKFAAVAFNRTTDFITDFEAGNWFEVDNNLVEKFNDEIYKARKFVATLIKNDWNLFPKIEEVLQAKEEIARLELIRNKHYVSPCKQIVQKQENILNLRGREIVRII